jgi:hypothetical protein
MEVGLRSLAKKPLGAPRRKYRPVLAARVPAEFLTRIRASARKHGRNASEELMWLAELGLNLNEPLEDANEIRQKAFAEATAILAAAERSAFEETKAGLTPALMEELLERAATRALEKLKETQS